MKADAHRNHRPYAVLVALTVTLMGIHSGFAGQNEPGAFGEQAEEKLDAGSRDLDPPKTLGERPPTDKPQVLIYYTAETAPDETQEENLETLDEWLRSTGNPEVIHFANLLKYDRRIFPQVVDEEIKAVKSGCRELSDEQPVGAAIFTNRLARKGRFEYSSVSGDSFRTAELTLPELDRPLYRSYPLIHPEALQRALTAVAEKFAPEEHEFVLILKSHGNADRILLPSVYVQTDQEPREKLIGELTEYLDQRMAELLEEAEPVVDDTGEPVPRFQSPADRIFSNGDQRIFSDGKQLLCKPLGALILLHDAEREKFYLADRTGEKVRTPGETRAGWTGIVLDREEGLLKVEGTDDPLQAGGEPVRVAGLQELLVPTRKWLKRRHDRKLTAWKPILGKESGQPILGKGADEPIMGKGAGEPIMGKKHEQASLGGTLYPDMAGPESDSPLAERLKQFGLGKRELVELIGGSAPSGMYFRTVFLESCKSRLGPGLIDRLRSEGAPIGTLWASDPRGLFHRTLDYKRLFDRAGRSRSLAAALNRELRTIYDRQHGGKLSQSISVEELHDPGFEVLVDLDLLRRAWRELDASLLTDAALQFAEAERILLRPHRQIAADDLLALAVRVASQKRDQESLERLSAAARERGNEQLTAQITRIRQLADETRDSMSGLTVPVDQLSPAEYRSLYEFRQALLRAQVAGDEARLRELREGLVELPGLSQSQKQRLQTVMHGSRSAEPAHVHIDERFIDVLNELAGMRRDTGVPPWMDVPRPKPK